MKSTITKPGVALNLEQIQAILAEKIVLLKESKTACECSDKHTADIKMTAFIQKHGEFKRLVKKLPSQFQEQWSEMQTLFLQRNDLYREKFVMPLLNNIFIDLELCKQSLAKIIEIDQQWKQKILIGQIKNAQIEPLLDARYIAKTRADQLIDSIRANKLLADQMQSLWPKDFFVRYNALGIEIDLTVKNARIGYQQNFREYNKAVDLYNYDSHSGKFSESVYYFECYKIFDRYVKLKENLRKNLTRYELLNEPKLIVSASKLHTLLKHSLSLYRARLEPDYLKLTKYPFQGGDKYVVILEQYKQLLSLGIISDDKMELNLKILAELGQKDFNLSEVDFSFSDRLKYGHNDILKLCIHLYWLKALVENPLLLQKYPAKDLIQCINDTLATLDENNALLQAGFDAPLTWYLAMLVNICLESGKDPQFLDNIGASVCAKLDSYASEISALKSKLNKWSDLTYYFVDKNMRQLVEREMMGYKERLEYDHTFDDCFILCNSMLNLFCNNFAINTNNSKDSYEKFENLVKTFTRKILPAYIERLCIGRENISECVKRSFLSEIEVLIRNFTDKGFIVAKLVDSDKFTVEQMVEAVKKIFTDCFFVDNVPSIVKQIAIQRTGTGLPGEMLEEQEPELVELHSVVGSFDSSLP